MIDTPNTDDTCKGCTDLLAKPASTIRGYLYWEAVLRDHLASDEHEQPETRDES